MTGEVASAARTALTDATAALRAEGHDVETIAALMMNAASALLIGRSDAQRFRALAGKMWRVTERQLSLLSLLDRVTARRGCRAKRARGISSPLGESKAT